MACVFRLILLLADDDSDVRRAAVASLGQLLHARASFDLGSLQEERTDAARRLKDWWKTERIRLLITGSGEQHVR